MLRTSRRKTSIILLIISELSCRSEDPDAEDVGHKWTLSALLRHLRSMGQDTELLMQRIEDIIIKSILATASGIVSGIKQFVKYPEACFGKFFACNFCQKLNGMQLKYKLPINSRAIWI